jgi:hypothetical protein
VLTYTDQGSVAYTITGHITSASRTDDGTVASAHVVEAWYGTHYLVLDAPLSEGEWELVTDDPRPAYCPALGAHTFEVGPPVADDWLGTLSLSRFVVHELPTGRQPVLLLQITLPPGHEALVDLGPGGPRLDATVDGVAAGRAPDELSLAVAGYLQVPIECPAGEERTLAIAVQARIGDEILEGFDASTTVTVRCDDAAPWPPDAGLVGSDVDGGPGGGAPSASCSASASRSSSFAWLAIVSSLALVARRRR